MQTQNDVKLANPVDESTAQAAIENLIKENELLVFMKGTSMMPQCGFSAQVVAIMSQLGVNYKAFNVLEEPFIREGIKEFSKWPTIPQIYYKGEFVGGCDIVTQMFQSGELEKKITA